MKWWSMTLSTFLLTSIIKELEFPLVFALSNLIFSLFQNIFFRLCQKQKLRILIWLSSWGESSFNSFCYERFSWFLVLNPFIWWLSNTSKYLSISINFVQEWIKKNPQNLRLDFTLQVAFLSHCFLFFVLSSQKRIKESFDIQLIGNQGTKQKN